MRPLLYNYSSLNDAFLEFTKEKGFSCEIVYYETPTELTNALINDEVDALVNSYIRTPEDEQTIENFGQTPYYIMARKEDQNLIDEIDYAIDCMNVETPNWRTDLYNKYEYGHVELNPEAFNVAATVRENAEILRPFVEKDAEIQTFIPETGSFENQHISGMLELASLNGNVVTDENDTYYHHTHAVFSYKDGEKHCIAAGHMKSITVLYTAEIELRPVTGGTIRRKYDPETGTGFWDFEERPSSRRKF